MSRNKSNATYHWGNDALFAILGLGLLTDAAYFTLLHTQSIDGVGGGPFVAAPYDVLGALGSGFILLVFLGMASMGLTRLSYRIFPKS